MQACMEKVIKMEKTEVIIIIIHLLWIILIYFSCVDILEPIRASSQLFIIFQQSSIDRTGGVRKIY